MKNLEQRNAFDRRAFLHSSAALGSLVLSTRSFAQESAVAPLNIAVIGTGAQGQLLLTVCMKIPGIRVQAICDIWANYNLNKTSTILQKYQQEHKTYTDYKELLAQETGLDAVLIATPDHCHAEQTIACLNAGLPVYCENMMANTVEGARQMVLAARQTGKLLQIGFQRRSNPRYRYAYDHIINETKLLGQITAANAQWNRAKQSPRGFPRRMPIEDAVLQQHGYQSMEQFRNWMWYKQFGGGPLAELASHQIDVMNWYLGTPPSSVLADGGTEYYDSSTHECPDTVMAVLNYPTEKNTVRASYQTINMNSNFGHIENFMGDEGTLYVSETGSRVKVYREPNALDWSKWVRLGILSDPMIKQPEQPKKEEAPAEDVLTVVESVIPPEYSLPLEFNQPLHQPHLENFFNTVRGTASLNCPAETAFAATVVVLKMQEAIASGNKITLTNQDFTV